MENTFFFFFGGGGGGVKRQKWGINEKKTGCEFFRGSNIDRMKKRHISV